MTSAEKAADLFAKMKGFRVKHSHAKKCAIVACDEIIKESQQYVSQLYHRVEYWQEVRSELEKIKTP